MAYSYDIDTIFKNEASYIRDFCIEEIYRRVSVPRADRIWDDPMVLVRDQYALSDLQIQTDLDKFKATNSITLIALLNNGQKLTSHLTVTSSLMINTIDPAKVYKEMLQVLCAKLADRISQELLYSPLVKAIENNLCLI